MPSAARPGKKHTYIVVLKSIDNEVESLYKELDSLISSKINKKEEACKRQRKNMPKGVCEYFTYWICSIQMNELKTKSYLAEFDPQNRSFCKYSDQGTFELGAKVLTSNNIEVDHLEKSSIIGKKWRNCL